MTAKTYRDKAQCPQKHKFVAIRRVTSAGKIVSTYCITCEKVYKLLAGPRRDNRGKNAK